MNAGDDDVELRERVVFQIELAFAEDVDLDAGEEVDAAFHLGVHLPHAGGVGERATVVHAVGHGEVLAVVGDGDVAAPARKGGLGHLADGAGAVGLGRVHVDVAVEVGERDELRQSACGHPGEACGGGLELTTVLAQFGRDVGETERVVDRFFRVRRDDPVVFETQQRVLAKA